MTPYEQGFGDGLIDGCFIKDVRPLSQTEQQRMARIIVKYRYHLHEEFCGGPLTEAQLARSYGSGYCAGLDRIAEQHFKDKAANANLEQKDVPAPDHLPE